MPQLNFGRENAKLKNLLPYLQGYLAYLGNHDKPELYTFSKLSGHDCPFAKECLSKAVKTADGVKIQDGPDTKFRCFSASAEVLFPNVYNSRAANSEAVKGLSRREMYRLIQNSFPKDCNVLRIHIGGDFKTQAEFDAWMDFAGDNGNKLFYAYTKSLPYWVKRIGQIPYNFILTASYGGHKDSLISQHGLRYAKVVFSNEEADKLKLKIDHDDSLAANPKHRASFALLIHGVQPKGTEAASAWAKVKANGGGYH